MLQPATFTTKINNYQRAAKALRFTCEGAGSPQVAQQPERIVGTI